MKALMMKVVVFVVITIAALAAMVVVSYVQGEIILPLIKKVAGRQFPPIIILSVFIAPAIEEGFKSLFLLKNRKSGFWAATLFAVYEFLTYIGMMVMSGQFVAGIAVLYRVPALIMHPATVVFHLNGGTRVRGWVRAVIAHTLFNVIAICAFTFEWWP